MRSRRTEPSRTAIERLELERCSIGDSSARGRSLDHASAASLVEDEAFDVVDRVAPGRLLERLNRVAIAGFAPRRRMPPALKSMSLLWSS